MSRAARLFSRRKKDRFCVTNVSWADYKPVNMEKINWGIIGCGDVTELKSGPAFNKVPNSVLKAVMRRDEVKVRDYAHRHKVDKWYTDASKLINDPDVNAIYIATPPSSHLEYALAAIRAGKPVYVEKPMTLNAGEAKKMLTAAERSGVKLTVAHYRRAQPLYLKLKELINKNTIGQLRYVNLELNKARLTPTQLKQTGNAWRVNGSIAGGGLFNDLAPHQLDILYVLLGNAKKINSITANQSGLYETPDLVNASMLFENNVVFNGTWCFSAAETREKDRCTIVGDKGSISFSFFRHEPLVLDKKGQERIFEFEPLLHVQQPMIRNVVKYFQGTGENPCSASDGHVIMQWIDQINRKSAYV